MQIDFRELISALLLAMLGGSGLVGLLFWGIKYKAEKAMNAKAQKKAGEEAAKAEAEQEIRDKLEAHDTQLKLQQDGITALLHDRIYQSCVHHIKEKEISVEDLRNLEYMYGPYHAMGGNGTCTELIERCRKLEMRVSDA